MSLITRLVAVSAALAALTTIDHLQIVSPEVKTKGLDARNMRHTSADKNTKTKHKSKDKWRMQGTHCHRIGEGGLWTTITRNEKRSK